jgi:hypothetical protein
MVCSELALELAQPKFAGRWTMEDPRWREASGEWTEVGGGDDDGGAASKERERQGE